MDWASLKPNNLDGEELPELLRQWAQANEHDEYPPYRSPWYRLDDAVQHQGTRFGGAAEVLPFLIEMALADETPWRASLVQLIVGIGEPVDPSWDFPYDADELAKLTAEELWAPDDDDDFERVNGFAMMCAVEGRKAWLTHAERLRPLTDDPDPEVASIVRDALASLERATA